MLIGSVFTRAIVSVYRIDSDFDLVQTIHVILHSLASIAQHDQIWSIQTAHAWFCSHSKLFYTQFSKQWWNENAAWSFLTLLTVAFFASFVIIISRSSHKTFNFIWFQFISFLHSIFNWDGELWFGLEVNAPNKWQNCCRERWGKQNE